MEDVKTFRMKWKLLFANKRENDDFFLLVAMTFDRAYLFSVSMHILKKRE